MFVVLATVVFRLWSFPVWLVHATFSQFALIAMVQMSIFVLHIFAGTYKLGVGSSVA